MEKIRLTNVNTGVWRLCLSTDAIDATTFPHLPHGYGAAESNDPHTANRCTRAALEGHPWIGWQEQPGPAGTFRDDRLLGGGAGMASLATGRWDTTITFLEVTEAWSRKR